jgi:hypothetical protein
VKNGKLIHRDLYFPCPSEVFHCDDALFKNNFLLTKTGFTLSFLRFFYFYVQGYNIVSNNLNKAVKEKKLVFL